MPPLVFVVLALHSAPLRGPHADDRADALARYGAARLQLARDQLPAAARNLEAAAKADPAATAPRRDLVVVYIDLGRDAAAIRTARDVLTRDPADADTGHALGRLLFAAKRFPEAAAVLGTAAASPALSGRPAKKLALLKDAARCRDEAADPAAAAAAHAVVVACLDGDRAALLRAGFAADELVRETASAEERRGRALVRAKKFVDAAAAFRTAAQLDRDAADRLGWHLSGVLQAAGDPAGALSALRPVLARRPDGAEPYQRFADLLRATGRGDRVVADLDAMPAAAAKWVAAVELLRIDFAAGHDRVKMLAHVTSDPAFWRATVAGYAAADRPGELLEIADAAYTAARPKPDDDDDAATDRTAAGDRTRGLADAVAAAEAFLPSLLRKATSDLPFNVARRAETVELLAWAADRAGRPGDAEPMLRAGLNLLGRDNHAVPLLLLKLLARQRRWADAIAVASGVESFTFQLWKAEAEAELGRGVAALRTLDDLAKNGRFAGGFYLKRQRARVYGILGRYRDMAAEAAAAMKEYPTPTDVRAMRFVLADAYLGLDQFDKAEAELRQVLDEDPDDTLALNNLGYFLADRGRKLAEAEAMVRRAVELDRDERARAGYSHPEHASYLDSLGWVRFRRGDAAEARRLLESAAALPDGAADPTVWDHLGDACFSLGDKAAAKAAWARAEPLYANSHLGREHDRLGELRRKRKLVE